MNIDPTTAGAVRPDTGQGAGALGYGCAGLFGLASKRERRAVLEGAYDLGIRHFDVAPMYGLGLAENELAVFATAHDDVRVVTKFGIKTTRFGSLAGMAQGPARRCLRRSAKTKARLQRSGAKRTAGTVGKLLYSTHDYSVANARQALSDSLRALKRDQLHLFLLHEPAGHLAGDSTDLVEFLEDAVRRGAIGGWGPAGDLAMMDPGTAQVARHAPAVQFPYDIVSGYSGPVPGNKLTVTFGFLSGGLAAVIETLRADRLLTASCSALIDADLEDERNVVGLLVRDAISSNPGGTVLLSSTRVSNLAMACSAADTPFKNEARAMELIARGCQLMRVRP